MTIGKVSAGVYRMRNGETAEVWARDASGNPLYPFYGRLPSSPEDDAWDEHGRNWSGQEYDLIERVGDLPEQDSGEVNVTNELLQALLERVEAATGPDREIDAVIMAIHHFREERFIGAYYEDGTQALDNVWVDRETNEWRSTSAHEFTASTDRALALVGRMLPGWRWGLHCHNGVIRGYVVKNSPLRPMPVIADAPTPPLALLAALLRAKATGGSHE